MCRIRRFPAAFVALILRDTGRLGFAAFGAELALIHRAAAARPAVRVASDIPTDFLHKVKGLLVNDSFMGILENRPFVLRDMGQG